MIGSDNASQMMPMLTRSPMDEPDMPSMTVAKNTRYADMICVMRPNPILPKPKPQSVRLLSVSIKLLSV